MKKYLSSSLILVLTACAAPLTTTLIPEANNMYTMSASSDSDADALKGGMQKATEYCQAQGKNIVVSDTNSNYTGGMDPDMKSTLNTVTQVVNSNTSYFVPGQSTSQDYTVKIKFMCK
jgi:hypothetical protein